MNNYRIGNITIEANNINELKEFSEQLAEMSRESGIDLPKHLGDTCFAIDVDYQTYHNLDADNWDIVH